MKKTEPYILMADVINSRKANQRELMLRFKKVITAVNMGAGKQLLSPMTITLGDEFQCISKHLDLALDVIVNLEETIIKQEAGFVLRYVLLQGEIDTPINPEIAYEMLGSGLTRAREELSILKNTKSRFQIILSDERRAKAISNALIALQSIIDDWKLKKDYYIVAKFLELGDYKQVALALDKERSLMWKRERSLHLAQYQALKDVIKYLGE